MKILPQPNITNSKHNPTVSLTNLSVSLSVLVILNNNNQSLSLIIRITYNFIKSEVDGLISLLFSTNVRITLMYLLQ